MITEADKLAYQRGVDDALLAMENQVAFWLANRYHHNKSVQAIIDRENETIEVGVESSIRSVRQRLADKLQQA